MKYKVGMYGGSFDPLHLGHIQDIVKASAVCEELYIFISWCDKRDSVSKELRYRWILDTTKHLTNIKIKLLEDKAVSKEQYNSDYYWENGANEIKAGIGKKIDVVFCGDDYRGTHRFENLYGLDSDIVYFDRKDIPVSSTEIKLTTVDHWDYIPQICKSSYVKKVLVIGGESTGKTTLVKNLALVYNTNFVEEVGRDVCEKAGGLDLMLIDDFYEILLKQKLNVIEASKNSNRILFVDTDAITTYFYAQFLFDNSNKVEQCKRLAFEINKISQWDLVLFLEPTVDFVQDGTRSEIVNNDRKKYSLQIKQLLKENGIGCYCIGGDYLNRFNKAKMLIKSSFGIDTKW